MTPSELYSTTVQARARPLFCLPVAFYTVRAGFTSSYVLSTAKYKLLMKCNISPRILFQDFAKKNQRSLRLGDSLPSRTSFPISLSLTLTLVAGGREAEEVGKKARTGKKNPDSPPRPSSSIPRPLSSPTSSRGGGNERRTHGGKSESAKKPSVPSTNFSKKCGDEEGRFSGDRGKNRAKLTYLFLLEAKKKVFSRKDLIKFLQ